MLGRAITGLQRLADDRSRIRQAYFGAYAAATRWAFAPCTVEGRAAMLVFDREVSLDTPAYFVALEFAGDRVADIQDFLYARYAMDGVEIRTIA